MLFALKKKRRKCWLIIEDTDCCSNQIKQQHKNWYSVKSVVTWLQRRRQLWDWKEKNPSKTNYRGSYVITKVTDRHSLKRMDSVVNIHQYSAAHPLLFFFLARLRVLRMLAVRISGGVSMWKRASWHSHTHSSRLKSESYCRDSQCNKNIRTLISPALSEGWWICCIWTWNAQFAPINCWCIIHAVTQTILEIANLINRRPRALISFQLC